MAPGSGGERLEIAVLPADGGAAVALGSFLNAAWPEWSPSGHTIAFTSLGEVSPTWLVSRDSISGPWHDPVHLTDFDCYVRDWAPDGSGVLCESPTRLELDLVSPTGTVLWRDELAARRRLTPVAKIELQSARYSRDGSTIYLAAVRGDGQSGVWAIPVNGGEARLVIAFDDPAVVAPGFLSVGPDRLYLTVSEYESDVWVMSLRY